MNKEEFKAHLLTIAKERPDCLLDLMMPKDSVSRGKNQTYLNNVTYYASEFELEIILNAYDDGENVNIRFDEMNKSVKIKELEDLDFSNTRSCSDNIVKEYIRLDAQNKEIVFGINNSFIVVNHGDKYAFFRVPGHDNFTIKLEGEGVSLKSSKKHLNTWKSYFDDINYYHYVEFKITEEFIREVESIVFPYLTEQQREELIQKLKNTKEKKRTTPMMSLFPYFCRLFDTSKGVDKN